MVRQKCTYSVAGTEDVSNGSTNQPCERWANNPEVNRASCCFQNAELNQAQIPDQSEQVQTCHLLNCFYGKIHYLTKCGSCDHVRDELRGWQMERTPGAEA